MIRLSFVISLLSDGHGIREGHRRRDRTSTCINRCSLSLSRARPSPVLATLTIRFDDRESEPNAFRRHASCMICSIECLAEDLRKKRNSSCRRSRVGTSSSEFDERNQPYASHPTSPIECSALPHHQRSSVEIEMREPLRMSQRTHLLSTSSFALFRSTLIVRRPRPVSCFSAPCMR